MALVFYRSLAIPLWVIAFFAVALTVPPIAALILIAALGIAVIRLARSVVYVVPWRHRDKTSAPITIAGGTRVRTLDEPMGTTADDALDLVRMDDDGGWQMPRPLA